ncbi:hemerythrin domain-containing protein [Sulfobacillus harzensis]|uniref:Hemerythrin-like domain-containing protein n=1 Tax=Sulfobacillus harzensis TaxID=2729629 RepID=A0A7Y0L6R8_9FIRM|nr:hemerythrin domain-containing protein [Sulfobacillus harzensis]NMP23977.1 hypothetical protein [Sulfobacillus harzensis]
MMSNRETALAMIAHHAEMAEELNDRAQAMGPEGDWIPRRDHIVRYLLDNVLPHAQAEESTIYEAAVQQVVLSALVQSMLWEHTVIRDMAHELSKCADRSEARMLAAQA